MAKERTSVRMQAQIKILSEQGHSIRSIARILRLSRRTVRKFLESILQPAAESSSWMETVDWEYVRQEVYGKGTTVKHWLHSSRWGCLRTSFLYGLAMRSRFRLGIISSG